ncbi:LOW QUALITY PROTEIN: histone H1.10-like [Haemorhous mexicanus]|uniref:LOW QUALITY PROTEIN: histone H1.10-like n=1 Tax=Haemorhous mexicanus TaxID=30427 RepID=UPI0028BDC510|nr:LOW QUALITY PROTEIN: histone H1.10-like [Haemorhous mexicanus]
MERLETLEKKDDFATDKIEKKHSISPEEAQDGGRGTGRRPRGAGGAKQRPPRCDNRGGRVAPARCSRLHRNGRDRPGPAAKKPKKAASGSKARKPAGPSVTELITKAVSASKERKGLSLAALKKALAAGGYDVEKNNSRIKLGLKSLVSKGTLVQIRGIGASGSFCLSKKPGEAKEKALRRKKTTVVKSKKPAAKKPASAAEKAVTAKYSPKKVKPAAKKAAKSPKVTEAVRPKKAVAAEKSPAKAVKPKAAKPKAAKAKRQHTRSKPSVEIVLLRI